MDNETRRLVQAIHDAPHRLVLVTAGAGTTALSDLLSVAGATRTLLEALVPYSAEASNDFLGQRPSQYVSANTAKLFAGRALTRARWLETESLPSIGLACTATIITDRPKKGEHRAHIACWQPERVVWRSIVLDKGARNREGEERIVSQLMLNTLAEACQIPQRVTLPLLPGDRIEEEITDFAKMTRQLLNGDFPFFGITDSGQAITTMPTPSLILSGAFNPLHDGHLGMAHAATYLTGLPAAFELAALNVDKPPLPPETILDRMAQFAGRYTVLTSRAPTFLEKARLYPGCTFVVGFDTAVRILHPRYYHNNPQEMLAALAEIQAQGCSFLVAGRLEDGRFQTANELAVPDAYANLFRALPESAFRHDISSTELRLHRRKGSR